MSYGEVARGAPLAALHAALAGGETTEERTARFAASLRYRGSLRRLADAIAEIEAMAGKMEVAPSFRPGAPGPEGRLECARLKFERGADARNVMRKWRSSHRDGGSFYTVRADLERTDCIRVLLNPPAGGGEEN